MALRYLFLCPSFRASTGGIAVIYDCVQELVDAGYSAAVLHEEPGYRYAYTPHRPPVLTTSLLRRKDHSILLSLKHPKQMLLSFLESVELWKRRIFRPADDLAAFGPDDVIVVPEFKLDYVVRTFPGQPRILFSQSSFLHLEAHQRARAGGRDPNAGMEWAIGINETSLDAIRLLTACPVSRVAVVPNLALFDFATRKRRQIAYMPRKRRSEAALIDHLLRQRGKLDGFDLVAVDGLPQAEVARILNDSLVFISLMRREALGFPAIEAMASGCIVVGYTGFGTREYFNDTTGVPVTEDDTVGLVAAVEGVVAEYSADPARLDALRQTASQTVRRRFAAETFASSLREEWARIDATLSGRARAPEQTATAMA